MSLIACLSRFYRESMIEVPGASEGKDRLKIAGISPHRNSGGNDSVSLLPPDPLATNRGPFKKQGGRSPSSI